MAMRRHSRILVRGWGPEAVTVREVLRLQLGFVDRGHLLPDMVTIEPRTVGMASQRQLALWKAGVAHGPLVCYDERCRGYARFDRGARSLRYEIRTKRKIVDESKQ